MSGGEIREMIDEEVNNDPEMSAEAENFDQDGIERKIFCDGNVYKQMEEGEEWILDQDEHYETIVDSAFSVRTEFQAILWGSAEDDSALKAICAL